VSRPAGVDPGLDDSAVRRAFGRSSGGSEPSRRLYAEAAERLMEHLEPVRIAPRVVVDVGAGFGTLTLALAERYRAATILAVDRAPGRLARIAPGSGRGLRWLTARRPPAAVCASWRSLPLRDASADLLASSMALHWDSAPAGWVAEMARVLAPGGLAAFSVLGPETLAELRAAWAALGERSRVGVFPDMHDLGDALQRHGFTDVVVDAERLSVTYEDPRDLLSDLRGLEAGNLARGRPRGLTTARRLDAMLEAYRADPASSERGSGKLRATIELVFAHAWRAAAGPRRRDTVEVSLTVPRGARRRGPSDT